MNLSDWLIQNEATLRLSFFLTIFAVMAIWEVLSPKRKLLLPKIDRWLNNIGLMVINTMALRLVFPVAAVGLAIWLETQNQGLLNKIELPLWLEIIFGLLLLDLLIYFQHRIFHSVPILWQLHKVHHADLDFDVTTGARFHTLEILISMLIKMAAIYVLGVPAVAVLAFETLLNASSMFNHGNIRIPNHIDKMVRYVFVTPDMHRIHHSRIQKEANSNYGFSISTWDRLFKTYTSKPNKGHVGMDIGISENQSHHQTNRLDGMMLMPFRKSSQQ
jgi:sterol desaturase/sphingolipid hydroxylase (fatty acid hydroxylase superfamily)